MESRFSVDTTIDADIQYEASKSLMPRYVQLLTWVCFGLSVVLLGIMVWQYVMTKNTMHLVLALLLVYAAYGARMDGESLTAAPACTGRRAGLIIVIIAAAVHFRELQLHACHPHLKSNMDIPHVSCVVYIQILL